jgi:hypothetical protein
MRETGTGQHVAELFDTYMMMMVRTVSEEILRLLWNLTFHCLVHKIVLTALILSQINPVHALQPHFGKVHFNIILPFTSRSSVWFHQSSFVLPSNSW